MRKIIAAIFAMICTFGSLGQTVMSDSAYVFFRLGSASFDPSMANNSASLSAFTEDVRQAAADGTLREIVVHGYASPEGPFSLNQDLARQRCEVTATEIVRLTGIDRSMVRTEPGGIAWKALRDLVIQDPEAPCREQIVEILDSPRLDNSQRLTSLQNLNRGGYSYLVTKLFPKLRYALAVSIRHHESTSAETEETTTYLLTPDATPASGEEGTHSSSGTTEAETDLASSPVEGPGDFSADVTPRHIIALKTNILYDAAALLPNLGLEWLINPHWSVLVDFNLAWWGKYDRDRSYRLGLVDAEVRRWIRPRAPWHGMYAGVIAGGGWYDLEKGTPGYRGEGLMTGLSFGYMWPISRSLSLEAEIGAGYVYTRYKAYEPKDGHHLYLRTKDINYFGPIKLNFSLVWRIFDRNKPQKKGVAL